MTAVSSSANTAQDRREFASRKVVAVLGAPVDDDSVTGWTGAYLAAAVHGVRSTEVAGKVARHLDRFAAFLLDGFGHDRIGTVTGREVALWRDQLSATLVRTLSDGRVMTMAPAIVNNHLAHLSAFFTWTAAHAPAGLLPHGDPTKGVGLLPLPAPEPRALNEAQLRTVKNVLDRLNEFHRLKGRSAETSQAGRGRRHADRLARMAIVGMDACLTRVRSASGTAMIGTLVDSLRFEMHHLTCLVCGARWIPRASTRSASRWKGAPVATADDRRLSMLQAEAGEDKLVAVISHLHAVAEAVEDVPNTASPVRSARRRRWRRRR